jgi:putative FmdB family regulatory protein
MPLYEYLCKKCGHQFEEIRKFSDKQPKKCPECGGVIEQLISAPAVQFKGSGWYVTDYAKKGAGSAASSAAGSSSEGDGGKDVKDSKDSKESKESKETKDTKEAKKDDKPKSDSWQKKHKKTDQ